MYIRTKRFRNKDGSIREYLYIVESVRQGDKVVQKTLLDLGRLDDLTTRKNVDSIIEGLTAFAQKQALIKQGQDLFSAWSKEYGPALIFRRLWERLGLGEFLSRAAESHGAKFDAELAIYAMVLHRLRDPGSKRWASDWLERTYWPGFEKLKLQHLYRAMDILHEHQADLEVDLATRERDLFSGEMDLVFCDTTTVSFFGEECDLLARGFSKDHRPDLCQIVVAMCLRRDGRPVAHHVFRGNTADTTVFETVLDDLTKRFPIRRVIFVMDRGMVSARILRKLRRRKLSYIVGVKMRRQKVVTEDVLARGGRYREVADNLRVKEVWVKRSRFIVCHNPEEEEKAWQDRISTLVSLINKLSRQGVRSLVGNAGYRRYLKIDGEAVTIDEERVAREKRYDGKYVLTTNTDLDAAEVALAYRELWKIERVFRTLKSTLEVGPVYHWTEPRIRAHVCICFLALVLEHEFTTRLATAASETNPSRVLDDLAQLRITHIGQGGKNYLLRTELHGQAYLAFQVAGAQVPPRLLEV